MDVTRRSERRQFVRAAVRRLHRDERGQSLAIILALVTVLFLMGSALAAHASVALRTTVANETQAGDLHAADAGAELGMWWQRNGKAGNPPNITVNALTVNTTVGITGFVPCDTPSPTRVTGFEHGALSTAGGGLFSNVNGAGVTIDNAVARTGSYSLKIVDPAGSTDSARIAVGANLAVVRLYLRLASLPAADVGELLSLDAATGNDLRIGYQSAGARLTIRFGNTAVTTSSSSVAAATWYQLDLRMVANTNPRTADWQLNGVAQTSISWVGGASTINSLRFGSTVSADPYTANYDDVLMTATSGDYPLGAGTVVALRPNGMGTSATPGSFRNNDGSAIDANTYTRVDDSPMTNITEYILQQTIGTTAYVELTMADTAAACVVGVSGVLAYHAQTAAADNGKASFFDGGTERVVYSGDMSQTAIQYASAIIAPAAAAWTPGAVNGLRARVGYSNDVTGNPYWDSLLLEVATGITVPGTVTVTSTAGNSTVTTTYTDVGNASPTLLSWSTTQ
jgi:hypothetical protein